MAQTLYRATDTDNLSGVARYRPYPDYKDTDVEWLNEVPTHWRVERLKHVATLNDETLSESTDPNFAMEYIDIGSVDPVKGIIGTETLSFADSPSRARRVVRDGDVIVSTVRTYLRAIAPIEHPPINMIVSTGFAVVRPKIIHTKFAFFLFRSSYFVERVVANSTGVGYPAINASEIGCFSICVPSIDEQHAIARFLDRETPKIDTLVAKKERLIELLKERRSALITRAVTKGLDPTVPMKDSGIEWLGWIPAHWDVKRINQTSEILRGKFTHRPRNDPSLYGGDWPFIQTGDVAHARKGIKGYRQTLNERGLAVSKMFPEGTLVMTIAANIGDVAVLDFAACFPDSIVGFVPRHGIERDYLFFVFSAIKPELLRDAPVNTQGNLNIERLSSSSPDTYPSEDGTIHHSKIPGPRNNQDRWPRGKRSASDRLPQGAARRSRIRCRYRKDRRTRQGCVNQFQAETVLVRWPRELREGAGNCANMSEARGLVRMARYSSCAQAAQNCFQCSNLRSNRASWFVRWGVEPSGASDLGRRVLGVRPVRPCGLCAAHPLRLAGCIRARPSLSGSRVGGGPVIAAAGRHQELSSIRVPSTSKEVASIIGGGSGVG